MGFGMRILYSGPRPKAVAPRLEADHVSFDTLMATADHVLITAPLTSATRHLVDAAALARMRDGATLVNVARGGLVDQDALVREAATGRIRAALDVTEPEPLDPGHPLLAMPNVLVVPHLGSASVRTRRAMADMAVANLRAGLAGERLAACANPDIHSRFAD
jgi:phosphoglycerate dehydrogenase-like enzyme